MSNIELAQVLSSLTGLPPQSNHPLHVGPGLLYVLELPNRSIRYLQRDERAFPKTFFNVVASSETADQLALPDDEDLYRQSWQGFGASDDASEHSYRVKASRRGGSLQVTDYRIPLRNNDGKLVGALGRLVDESFRSLAMDALVNSSWHEIANSMTRRFLHDFNNTIAGIYSLSELYAEPGSDAQSMVEAMTHIRDNSIRAQDITRRIRHVTSLADGEPSYFDLNELLKKQEGYLDALLPKGVSINYDLEDGDLPVKFDANRFQQSLLHLACNARDAAEKDFQITLRTRRVDQDGKALVRLEVADNAGGIRENILHRVTDPFFTTKKPNAHPGLGLNIVSGFVEQLGGTLQIASVFGEGTTVSLTLPIARIGHHGRPIPATPAEPAAAPSPTEPAARPTWDVETSVPAATAPTPQSADTPQDAPSNEPPSILIYTWEDITRHPLIRAIKDSGWTYRIHLDPGQMLIDLSTSGPEISGALIFKSALDERAAPLVSEIGRARNAPRVALVALGESIDALSENVKRNCGLLASGSTKPAKLLNQLSTFFRS